MQQRLAQPAILTRPGVAGDRLARLVSQMEAVQMSVARLDSAADIVAGVHDYLSAQAIEPPIVVAPALGGLDWPVAYRSGPATGEETTAITPCVAAVAETGSLVLCSSAATPTPMNFLPENHIVVLYHSQVVDTLEDVWPRLRQHAVLPRTVNLITGPSRTADIEQTLEIGAHGPRRLHVLLIASDAGTASATHGAGR